MNWKVRFKNKMFWLALIPAILVLAQVVLALFDVKVDFTDLQAKLIAIVDAVFVLLSILGIAVDMTTAGIKDSERAMSYTEPYKAEEK